MTLKNHLKCFKAYDVRGRIGDELDENIAYRIGRGAAELLKAKLVVLGFDSRESSPSLANAIAQGICDSGADVLEIGLAGTEEMYSAVSAFNAEVGIEVTASHNPIEYNGMKLVKQASQPLTENEFNNIRQLAEKNKFFRSPVQGSRTSIKSRARELYLEKILSFIKVKELKALKIVINSGNGAAGPVIDHLKVKLEEKGVKTNFFYVHHTQDSSFPNGIPNPLLEENRNLTANAVVQQKADFGVAFDGDFDRCFLFDNKGNFIPGEYVMGLLSEIFLGEEEGGAIIHDNRVIWNTIDVVQKFAGNAIVSKAGHAFFKAAMRDKGAVYGGEISSHHYFRDFHFCDSGMIPWLMTWEYFSRKATKLSDFFSDRKNCFPSSGEINFSVSNTEKSIKKVKNLISKNLIES